MPVGGVVLRRSLLGVTIRLVVSPATLEPNHPRLSPSGCPSDVLLPRLLLNICFENLVFLDES